MKRLEFLKRLGLGAAAAVVAPSAFISKGNTKFVDADDLKTVKTFYKARCYTPDSIGSPMELYTNGYTATCSGIGIFGGYGELFEMTKE